MRAEEVSGQVDATLENKAFAFVLLQSCRILVYSQSHLYVGQQGQQQ